MKGKGDALENMDLQLQDGSTIIFKYSLNIYRRKNPAVY